MQPKTHRLGFVLAALTAMFFAGPLLADWNPGDFYKMHFPQEPDPLGWDICLMDQYLADDFMCTQSGEITDIHIWFSWLDGIEGQIVDWEISIYDDDPSGPTGSQPGVLLWTWDGTGTVLYRDYGTGNQGWYCPLFGLRDPADHQQYDQVNITDIGNPFSQAVNQIYWLVLRVWTTTPAGTVAGWKTSINDPPGPIWGGPALWSTDLVNWDPIDTGVLVPELHDMAFVITGRAEGDEYGDAPEDALAYPSSGVVGMFPTCMNVPIAGHVQHGQSQVFFGHALAEVDYETEGNAGTCPSFNPDNYDQDECFNDGDSGLLYPEPFTIAGLVGSEAVVPCPNSAGTSLGPVCTLAEWCINLDIRVTNNSPNDAFVNVLMDWDQNGMWAGSSDCPVVPVQPAPEHVLVDYLIPPGFSGEVSTAPGGPPPPFLIGPDSGYVWARFSITDVPVLTDWNGEGFFNAGETEDYLFRVDAEQPDGMDLGDAPDSSNNFGVGMTAYPPGGPLGVPAIYPTVYLTGSPPFGPIHLQPQAMAYLGTAVTLENEADIGPDQDPTNNLDPPGDLPDLDGADDGVIFPLILPHCQQATFDYVVTVTAAVPQTLFVNVWFDWTRNGDWDDTPQCPNSIPAPEWAVQNQALALPGLGQFTFTTPQFLPWHPNAGDPMEELWMRITLSEQQWTPGAMVGFGGSGPAAGYEFGETEDYFFMPLTPMPKWSQWPHGPDEGFDAASDLWWTAGWPPNAKWQQDYDKNLAALHAHDGPIAGERLILANDWLCMGGLVTDLHWWGGIEQPGSGLWGFRLSIHDNDPQPCLPIDPPLWFADVPIAQITVTNTGDTDPVGTPLNLYEFDLPTPFDQVAGQRYWLDISAISKDPDDNVIWKWAQSSPAPILCPAAQRQDTGGLIGSWQTISSGNIELAFRITSDNPAEPINKVVADDFVSDGRPIETVRWWGSYLDDRYDPFGPVAPAEPFIQDGWVISFHHGDPAIANPGCPPDVLQGDDPTALGLYFAPFDAVTITPMGYLDCNGQPVYDYKIDLSKCCLLCAETDPRDGSVPAEDGVFREVVGFKYWLDIQAVVGITWRPESVPPCVPVLTGHLPPENGAHFWGWHTSPGPLAPCDPMNEACTGRIVNFVTLSLTDCWDYGDWNTQAWECPDPPEPVHMAFELITTEPMPCPCPGDVNGDGVVNGLDIQAFCDCILGNPLAPGVNCACCDYNCTKLPDAGDIPGFVADLLSTKVCP